MGVAGADADQEAWIDPVVEAGRGAAEVVGQRAGIAIALHRAQAAQAAGPHAPGTGVLARRDVAGLGERLTRAVAAAPARHRHLLAERVHEQHAAGHVGGAETSVRLRADGVEHRRAQRRRNNAERADHRDGVATGAGEGLVEGDACRLLVGRLPAIGERHRQRQIGVVGVVAERWAEEGVAAGDA